MKRLLICLFAGLMFVLGGCVVAPTSQPPGQTSSTPQMTVTVPSVLQMTPEQACGAWGSFLKAASQMDLNAVQVQGIGILESKMNPLCPLNSAPPSDTANIQGQIQQALLQAAAIEAVNYAIKAMPAPSQLPATPAAPVTSSK